MGHYSEKMNMNDFNITEWTCVWTMSMVALVAIVRLIDKIMEKYKK